MFSTICMIIYVKCICYIIVLEQSGTLYNGLDQTRSSLEMVWNSLGMIWDSLYQVLAVEQVSVNAKEGGNDCCIYLAVEQVYYT